MPVTMILITGASGQMGRAVLTEVKRKGLPCRALYRSEEDAHRNSSPGESVIADFADPPAMQRALAGISLIYLVCSPIPALVELESAVIDSCVAAGVKQVLLNSALGAADYGKSFPAWHRKVEEKLKSSGLAYTIFRPNGFMQNILAYYARNIRTQDAFYASTGSGRTSFLDIHDIAAGIAQALAAPDKHQGMIYELNGPNAVSGTELAERISQVAQRKISYVDLPEEAQRQSMLALGMPEWQVTALLDLQAYYREGRGGDVTPVLAELLGRPPLGLDRFLQENASEFESEAVKAEGR